MTNTTQRLIQLTESLGSLGFALTGIEVRTPDGRTWSIATATDGHGRSPDGHWGPCPGALGGFRLFEIDPDGRRGPDEHHAIDDDTWTASDLIDYLKAVGEPRPGPNDSNPTGPTC